MRDKPRILIVDDVEVVRQSYAAILSGADCETQMAPDGNEALREMASNPADVVLLDLRMPGPDGLSVLETIKQKWPDAEVVVITGYPTVDSAKKAVRLGAYDYLAKPVGPDEVIQAARGALLRKQWALRENALN